MCFDGSMGRHPWLRAADLNAQTARLRLNLVVEADADELHLVLDDPELHHFTGGAPLPLAELRQRVATWQRLRSPDGRELWLNWTVRLRATGALAGHVQATVRDGVASIAYVIGRAYWGQGLATEAAEAMCRMIRERLGIEELVAHIHPLHQASQRVARHLALARTGEVDAEGEEIWRLRLSGPTA